MMDDLRKGCPMRHENGNCTVIGGFCTAVNDLICEGLHHAYDSGYRAALLDQKHQNAKLPGWISVKDRLPEKSGYYIVYYSNTASNKPLISMRHFYGEIPGAFLRNKAMTHWMPLPEPPKEENQDA